MTHWSDLEGIFLTQKSFSYVVTGKKLGEFAVEASRSSFANLLEVANFVLFLVRRCTIYFKSKAIYDQYVQQRAFGENGEHVDFI